MQYELGVIRCRLIQKYSKESTFRDNHTILCLLK